MDETAIQVQLARMEAQLGRILSDIESEKNTRKRRNETIDERLRDLEQWKSNMQGRMIMGVFIWGVVQAVIIWFITK